MSPVSHVLVLVGSIPLSPLCSCSELKKVSKPKQDETQAVNPNVGDTSTCDLER